MFTMPKAQLQLYLQHFSTIRETGQEKRYCNEWKPFQHAKACPRSFGQEIPWVPQKEEDYRGAGARSQGESIKLPVCQ